MSTWRMLAIASLIFPVAANVGVFMCFFHITRHDRPARMRWAVITLALCLATLISATIFDGSWITIATWTAVVLGWLIYVIVARRWDLRRAHDEAEARRAQHEQEAASQWSAILERQMWAQQAEQFRQAEQHVWAEHRRQQYRRTGTWHPRPLELEDITWEWSRLESRPSPLELNAAPEPREDDVK